MKLQQLLNQTSKRRLKTVFFNCGITPGILRFKSLGKALILSYHRVSSKKRIAEKTRMPGMYVSDESFRMQLTYLCNHYNMVDLDTIVEMVKAQKPWREAICAITFDDGWHDVYEYAFPLLKELNVPATVFIVGNAFSCPHPDCFNLCFEIMVSGVALPENLTTIPAIDAFINSCQAPLQEKARQTINKIRNLPLSDFKRCYNSLLQFYMTRLDSHAVQKDYRTLSWDEVHEMQQAGIGVGYHSYHHYMLTKVPEDLISFELCLPTLLATASNINISPLFCYPDGDFNPDIVATLRRLGYAGATSLIPGFNDYTANPYLLKRVNIHEDVSSRIEDFVYLLGSQSAWRWS